MIFVPAMFFLLACAIGWLAWETIFKGAAEQKAQIAEWHAQAARREARGETRYGSRVIWHPLPREWDVKR